MVVLLIALVFKVDVYIAPFKTEVSSYNYTFKFEVSPYFGSLAIYKCRFL